MDHPSGCFARLRARELPDNPLSGPDRPATKVSRNRILRQIEEGGQRWLLRQAVQVFPLRDEQNLRRRLSDQRHEGER